MNAPGGVSFCAKRDPREIRVIGTKSMDSAALSGGSMLRTFSHFLLGGLPFLMASRYCETDLLSNFAWSNFGSIKDGWAKVQAVCDYVNDRLTFS
jgi:hypothetical protein